MEMPRLLYLIPLASVLTHDTFRSSQGIIFWASPGFLKLASCTFPQRLLSNPNCLKGDVAFCSSLRNVAVLILPAIKHC